MWFIASSQVHRVPLSDWPFFEDLKEAIGTQIGRRLTEFDLFWAADGDEEVPLDPSDVPSQQFLQYWHREDANRHKDRFVIVKPTQQGLFFFFS